MSTPQSFQHDDYFKIDPELHLVGDMQLYNHFPGVQMWWKAIAMPFDEGPRVDPG